MMTSPHYRPDRTGSGLDWVPRCHGGSLVSLPGEPAEPMPTETRPPGTRPCRSAELTADQVATLLLCRRRPRPAVPVLGEPRRAGPAAPVGHRGDHRTTLAENRLLQLVVAAAPTCRSPRPGVALPAGTAVADIEPVEASLEEVAPLSRHDGRVDCSGTLTSHAPRRPARRPRSRQRAADEHLKSAIDSVRTVLAASRSPRGAAAAGDGTRRPPAAEGGAGRGAGATRLHPRCRRRCPEVGAGRSGAARRRPARRPAVRRAGRNQPRPTAPTRRHHESEPGHRAEPARAGAAGAGQRCSAAAEVGVALRGGRPIDDLAPPPGRSNRTASISMTSMHRARRGRRRRCI